MSLPLPVTLAHCRWALGSQVVLEQFQQDQPCRCAQVSHGCSVTWPCLIPELSAGSLPIPGELHPSMQVTLTWLCFPKNCSCHCSPQDPSHGASRIRALQVCTGVQLLLLVVHPTSQSTCNSLCCSSGASCSPVLPLALGTSCGIKLVRLAWIQVLQVWILQTHLVLPALPWTGIHGKPTCALDLSGICLGVKLFISGAFPFFGFSQVRSAWPRSNSSLARGRRGGKLGCGVVPQGFAHLDALGFWDLLTCSGLCPKTCILLTWTLQTVGSAHLDLLTWWDLCLQDLLTWMLPDPRVTGTQIPQSSFCPPPFFSQIFGFSIAFSSSFPTLGSDPHQFWGSPGAPGGHLCPVGG